MKESKYSRHKKNKLSSAENMKEKSSPVNWKNKSTLILPSRHQIDENGNVYDLQNCFSSAASVWQEHTQKGAPTELLHFSSAALSTPYVNDLSFWKN